MNNRRMGFLIFLGIALSALMLSQLLPAAAQQEAHLKILSDNSCSLIYVELTDAAGGIAHAEVLLQINGAEERFMTDQNGRFFTMVQGCAAVSAAFAGDKEHLPASAQYTQLEETSDAGAGHDAAGIAIVPATALIPQLQESIVKIDMPGSRGSGVILAHEAGQTVILTNKHVIMEAEDQTDLRVLTAHGKALRPTDVRIAPKEMDLAILVVDGVYGTPAKIASSGLLQGEDVLALGSPKGIQGSVSKGIISNFGTDMTKSKYTYATIQTDTAINKGNSGGGLFLERTGELIGINTFQMKDAEGLNFAIRISELEKLGSYKGWQEFR